MIIKDELLQLLVSACYLVGCRYLLGLGDIEQDIKFLTSEIKYYWKRVVSLFKKSRFYTAVEIVHQKVGSDILRRAFS